MRFTLYPENLKVQLKDIKRIKEISHVHNLETSPCFPRYKDSIGEQIKMLSLGKKEYS